MLHRTAFWGFVSASVLLAGAIGCSESSGDDRDYSGGENVGQTQQSAITIPAGFNLINSWTASCPSGQCNAVRVFKKDWVGGKPDYVIVADLRYATLRSLTGSSSGAPCATVGRKSIGTGAGTFWADAVAQQGASLKARVVVNGTYFSTNNTPTGIAFGLKKDGSVLSYGYGVSNGVCSNTSEFPGNNFLFGFSMANKRAWIGAYSKATMDNSTPDFVGALGPLCCKGPSNYTGRTFVGIRDDDGDSNYETVFIFASEYAKQSGIDGADDTLSKFGATVRAMLDGGGSTGLVVDGAYKVSPTRTVPQVLALFSP